MQRILTVSHARGILPRLNLQLVRIKRVPESVFFKTSIPDCLCTKYTLFWFIFQSVNILTSSFKNLVGLLLGMQLHRVHIACIGLCSSTLFSWDNWCWFLSVAWKTVCGFLQTLSKSMNHSNICRLPQWQKNNHPIRSPSEQNGTARVWNQLHGLLRGIGGESTVWLEKEGISLWLSKVRPVLWCRPSGMGSISMLFEHMRQKIRATICGVSHCMERCQCSLFLNHFILNANCNTSTVQRSLCFLTPVAQVEEPEGPRNDQKMFFQL